MVHVQSKYPINLSLFNNSPEVASYWFGYLRSRAYMFPTRHRIRCRTPLSDIGHLFQLTKDLGSFKAPRIIQSERGGYAQLIIDNKQFYDLMVSFGWKEKPTGLDWRHVVRGIVDGRGSISRNGSGKQAKYLRLALYLKDKDLIDWLTSKIGPKKVWVGSEAIKLSRQLYFNQSRYLGRKFEKLRPFIL